jgi:hypothetical protein
MAARRKSAATIAKEKATLAREEKPHIGKRHTLRTTNAPNRLTAHRVSAHRLNK